MLGFLVIYLLFSAGIISDWLALLLCFVQVLDIITRHHLVREYDFSLTKTAAGCISAAIAAILAWLVVMA